MATGTFGNLQPGLSCMPLSPAVSLVLLGMRSENALHYR